MRDRAASTGGATEWAVWIEEQWTKIANNEERLGMKGDYS